jgi:CRISPR-associated endonuclease/helicase Cas3
MEYFAHTYELPDGKRDPDESHWQPLREHLANVAKLAAKFASEARPGEDEGEFAQAAYAAGLLHDLGKYRPEFQRMIRGLQPKGESTRHKQAGAAQAVSTGSKHFDICFSILGHHGGIPDKADMAEAVKAGSSVAEKVLPAAHLDFPELKAADHGQAVTLRGTEFDIRTRLLFSCLVDADWLDTSDFHARREGWAAPTPLPQLDASQLLQNVLAYIAQRAKQCRNTDVARIRAEILAAALRSGNHPQGIFSMTVPTGGGKTLSALAFALQHAVTHGLKRIIYVAPYLSIIEQNAAVFRAALGEPADNLILEHHSMTEPGNDSGVHGDDNESQTAQRLAENWEAPIILTTSVQFYESLFSNQPSRCRKLHNVAQSVVILDECQTLPAGFTAPTCEMLEQAAAYMGCSIVLCTATQPAWKKDPVRLPMGISRIHEIAPNPVELFRQLKRVEITWPQTGAANLNWAEIAAEMVSQQQVLCVVNTRQAALEIYREVATLGGEAIHLSTNMCPAHRLSVLKDITAALQEGRTCRVVSTQLVEAGVDLDFPVVMRELAPLESIVQAAGRCNREGLLKSGSGGRVLVFRSRDGKMPPGSWYRNGAKIVEQDFLACGRQPRIDHPEDIAEYYRRLYPTGDLDSKSIHIERSEYNFQSVAESYKIIDSVTTPLVVWTWEPAREEIEKLLAELRQHASRSAYRRLQRYTVNVYEHEFRRAASACVMNDPPGVNVCSLPYDNALGLVISSAVTVPAF